MAEQMNGAETTKHISCLPSDIMRDIFAMLDVKSKGQCARVCRDWLTTCYLPAVWKGVWFRYRRHILTDNPTLVPSLARRGIENLDVRVNREEGGTDYAEQLFALNSIGPHLTVISLAM